MNSKINIGVLGCANIAQRSVIPAIIELRNRFNLVAIASRSKEKAELFAKQFNCEAIDSYETMINRTDIDALYIPLPTGLHKEWINKALKSGKHVYAEKSIAFTSQDVSEMILNARDKKLVLMEGFMFQYHKQHEHLKELLNQNIIGEIRSFKSSFGFPPLNEGNFRYDPEVGGGSLYDAGAYPVSASLLLLGDKITNLNASLFFNKSGVNIFGNGFIDYSNGIASLVSFGFDNYYQCNYEIWGSEGKITVLKAFTPKPNEIPLFKLEKNNKETFIKSYKDNHFQNAFIEFYDAISDGLKREKHYSKIQKQVDILEYFYNSRKK